MKTEAEIRASIDKVQSGLKRTVETLSEEIEAGDWADASETLFTLIANVSALEATERMLK